MRHLTPASITDRNFPLLKVGKPRPFPGEWPTRIHWMFSQPQRDDDSYHKQWDIHQYLGKPNDGQAGRLISLLERRTQGYLPTAWTVREFDQAQTLYYATSDRGAPFFVSPVWRAYHPWDMEGGMPLHWFAGRFYHKRPGDFAVYSPYATLKELQLGEFKQMMWDNFGMALRGFTPPAKPTPKPPEPKKVIKEVPMSGLGASFTIENLTPAPQPTQRRQLSQAELEQVPSTEAEFLSQDEFNRWLNLMNNAAPTFRQVEQSTQPTMSGRVVRRRRL